jgi:hypothetical protein
LPVPPVPRDRGLAEHGIHDDYIWALQHHVAEEIEATLAETGRAATKAASA